MPWKFDLEPALDGLALGMASVEEVLVWAILAFVIWLALVAIFGRLGVKGHVVVAAALSWLVAGALLWWFPLLIDWIRSRLET
jgi:membrane associated rhomboid family serine protease